MSKNYRHHLAIVGGAAGAIHLLAELAHRKQQGSLPRPFSIVVIDPAISADGGSPHSDLSPAFRVNMRTKLHNVPDQITFESFLRQYGGGGEEPPLRADLGRYLTLIKHHVVHDLMGLYKNDSGKHSTFGTRGCSVTFVRDTAISLVRDDRHPAERNHLHLKSGKTILATNLVLATGNAPPLLPLNVHCRDGSLHRVSFYDGSSSFAAGISPQDRVLVLGIGPGGIDVARYLIEELGSTKRIDVVSRNGLLSAVQFKSALSVDVDQQVESICQRESVSLADLKEAFLPVLQSYDPEFRWQDVIQSPSNALATLANDISAAAADGPRWRHVLEAIAQHAPRIWARLADDAKLEFLDKHERQYYVKRHAMQMATARWLASQLATGPIRIGKLEQRPVKVDSQGVWADVALLPGGMNEEQEQYDRLVIATGPDYSVSDPPIPSSGS